MKARPKKADQGNFLFQDLLDQLNPRNPWLKLAGSIPWERFEEEFAGLYAARGGRPSRSGSWSGS